MTGVDGTRSRRRLELASAAALGGACAYATARLLIAGGFAGIAPGAAILAAGLAWWISYRALCAIAAAGERLPLPGFAAPTFPDAHLDAPDALLLDEVYTPPADAEAERTEDVLELDDILTELSPDSRVVRLFDSGAMPTAGQMRASIERHIGGAHAIPAPADASAALHQALADLRRSLR